MLRKSFVVAALLASAAASMPAAAQVVVIVNPKNGASLSKDDVADLYLGKNKSFPGGAAAALVDQGDSAAVRGQFYEKATGKSAAQVKAAWSRLVFSGKATPPKEVGSSDEVKKFVAANADAIGYIEKSAVDGSVKAVLTLD
jgi:ABC-type phosphate transport system substrate-binding protein